MSLSPGDVIDNKYEIVRLLGEGGMGAVFEGRNRLIERRVAIKVLHAAAREAVGVVERFEREARAAGLIGGDHILEVLDLGTLATGDRYMVLEFLDGETLAQRISRRGRLTTAEIAPLLRQALVGLRGAHAAGIVHRDLKPDNLFILKEKAGHKDFLKIIDFGVSKFGGPSSELRMTRTGSVMGTPYYMSPEQAKGAASVNHQSDLYSLGVIAFEAVTGSVPFDGTSFNDLMFKIVLSEMPDLDRIAPGVDAKFCAIVRKAMAKEVERRYVSADDFLADIDEYLSFVEPVAVSGMGVASLSASSQKRGQVVRTHAEWTKTSGEAELRPRSRSKSPLWLGVGVALTALVGVGAWFAVRRTGEVAAELVPELPGSSSVPPASAASVAVAPEPPSPKPSTPSTSVDSATPAPVESTAKPGDLGSSDAAGSRPPSSAEPSSAESTAKPTQTVRRSSASRKAPTTSKPTPVQPPDPPVRVIEAAPVVREAPVKEAPPAAKPVEKPVKKPTTSSRDFGY